MLAAFFRAECSNAGAGKNSWTNVDILVDGIPLSATSGSDAFCTSNGSSGHDQWVMARTSGATSVTGPGVHTVEVMARSMDASESSLFDSELVVMVPEPGSRALQASGLIGLVLLAGLRRPERLATNETPSERRRAIFRAAILVLSLGLVSSVAARADTVMEGTRRPGNQIHLNSQGPVLVDLGTGPSFTLYTPRPTVFTIFLTAECAVSGADTGTWLDVDILVDGVAVHPSSDSDDAFCTSNGGSETNADEWVSVAHHVTVTHEYDEEIGPHTIEVRAQARGNTAANTEWWIGDLSLSVIGFEL